MPNLPKKKKTNKPELLLPAGNLSKLKTAILFGADAVYVGGRGLSLRSPAEMDYNELKSAVLHCRKNKAKIYLAANLFLHEQEINNVKKQLAKFLPLKFDAVIVSDPGVIALIRKLSPTTKIHLSVQANTLNSENVKFWQKQGVKRIVLARELSFKEIKAIRNACPNIELEVFVHGALCLSYSGRCYLSQYLSERDANRGACAYPCRWKYYLSEEKDPQRKLEVAEDERGVHLLNIKDLCLAKHLPDLIKIGINSFKVEGRMKSEHYVGSVGRVYRQIIDTYLKSPPTFKFNNDWISELKKVSNRTYSVGFFNGQPGKDQMRFASSQYVKPYRFVGIVTNATKTKTAHTLTVQVKDLINAGDQIEIIDPKRKKAQHLTVKTMSSKNKGKVARVGAGYEITISAKNTATKGSLLRVKT